MSAITLTFGDQAENHVGMQTIGSIADCGFTPSELRGLSSSLPIPTTLIDLNQCLPEGQKVEEAVLLLVHNGLDMILGEESKNLWAEQASLPYDTKAFMYGRVVNKKARHNLCFSEVGQEPDYAQGKGRIIPYSSVPLLAKVLLGLKVFGPKASNLVIESNYYYDIKSCGIGFHGDTERRKVIGLRLGDPIPLDFQWFYQSKPVGNRLHLTLQHGDMYIMSEKATGNDWKKRNTLTLRHAAGAPKYLQI